jgi:hypothetical protein
VFACLTGLLPCFQPPLSLVTPHAPTPPQKDYVGLVAAEAAYSALLSDTAPVNPAPVDPKNCPTCGGTGRVRTGGDRELDKVPDVQPR